MTNLYYDDPLQAAWMIREFGVKIRGLYLHGNEDEEDMTVEQIAVAIDRVHGCDVPTRYNIHTDSLHVFEPMDGDLVHIKYYVKNIDGVPAPSNTYSGYMMLEQSSGLENDRTERQIIQRNGKAFFMPKEQSK